jgi:hypothetical protein
LARKLVEPGLIIANPAKIHKPNQKRKKPNEILPSFTRKTTLEAAKSKKMNSNICIGKKLSILAEQPHKQF